MINQKESTIIREKFLHKLYDYMQKDEKERNLILKLMITSFVIALIFTVISSIMIYISFQKSVKVDNNNLTNIVEGESTNE